MRLSKVADDGSIAQLTASPLPDGSPAASRDEFERVLGRDAFGRCVILNLSGLEELTSAAAGWLLSANRHFHEAGGKLVLYALTPRAQDVLRVMRLDQVLSCSPDEESARALAGW